MTVCHPNDVIAAAELRLDLGAVMWNYLHGSAKDGNVKSIKYVYHDQ